MREEALVNIVGGDGLFQVVHQQRMEELRRDTEESNREMEDIMQELKQ